METWTGRGQKRRSHPGTARGCRSLKREGGLLEDNRYRSPGWMRGGDLAIRQARTPQHKVVHKQWQSQLQQNNDKKGAWSGSNFLFPLSFLPVPLRGVRLGGTKSLGLTIWSLMVFRPVAARGACCGPCGHGAAAQSIPGPGCSTSPARRVPPRRRVKYMRLCHHALPHGLSRRRGVPPRSERSPSHQLTVVEQPIRLKDPKSEREQNFETHYRSV